MILEAEAHEELLSLDFSVRLRIEKKLKQLRREDLPSRHLKHGSSFFIAEIGQYRVAYKTRVDLRLERIFFVGDHKSYERWYREQE